MRDLRWSGENAPSNVVPMPGTSAARAVFRKQLGYTLARCRELKGLTQEAAASELRVNTQTLSRWETGTHECKPYDLHRLAKLYDAPPEWLIYPSDSLTEWEIRIAQSVSAGLRRGLDRDEGRQAS